jgi:membrane protease YdiL (CAAX protease family)
LHIAVLCLREGAMGASGLWRRIPLIIRAIVGGVLVALVAANVWPLLLGEVAAPVAAAVELVFLAAYVAWFAGLAPGPWRAQRREFGRVRPLSRGDWTWGILAALAFAASVHAAIVVLFRLVPFPAAAFHAGYDLAAVPTLPLKWLVCVVSALSAGVCEEMGLRGYLQRPLEIRHGAVPAILVSAVVFALIHLNKSWALLAMTPIVFGAGLMLGALARASASLVFAMLGHWIMDIGLFAFWWTQIAGVFAQRPISATGIDLGFLLEVLALAVSLAAFLFAVRRLAQLARGDRAAPRATEHPAGAAPA